MEDNDQDGHHRGRHLHIRDRHHKGQVLREPIQDKGGREASGHMAQDKIIRWRLRIAIPDNLCGLLDKGAHQEESSIGSIIISIFKRAGSAGERFSAHFFVRRTLFIERKGVGDMRVRLYSF